MGCFKEHSSVKVHRNAAFTIVLVVVVTLWMDLFTAVLMGQPNIPSITLNNPCSYINTYDIYIYLLYHLYNS